MMTIKISNDGMNSCSWQDPQDAAKLCKEAGLSAKEGLGKVYTIEGGDKKTVNWVVKDVQRRIGFMTEVKPA